MIESLNMLSGKQLSAHLAVLVVACLYNTTVNAQTLPDHTVEIANGVYSYGPGDQYYSMFVVTDEGVIALESVNTGHATGLLAAIRGVTDQPVKYLLHSHNHWDHASGGQVFKDAGAKTLAHAEAYEWMKANVGRDMAGSISDGERRIKEVIAFPSFAACALRGPAGPPGPAAAAHGSSARRASGRVRRPRTSGVNYTPCPRAPVARNSCRGRGLHEKLG